MAPQVKRQAIGRLINEHGAARRVPQRLCGGVWLPIRSQQRNNDGHAAYFSNPDAIVACDRARGSFGTVSLCIT